MDDRDVGAHWDANAPAWTALVRAGYDVWRDVVNTPAFLTMLPPVAAFCGLDIGCGEGANTRSVARLGAKMTGVDISRTFIENASEEERREPLGIDYLVTGAQALPFEDGRFAFATAFMSFMDMADFAAALREANRVIRSGGFLQFSILHPCFFSPDREILSGDDGHVVAVRVGRYFEPVQFVEEWTFSGAPAEVLERWSPFRVPLFHRTLSEYLNGVIEAGFQIERIGEPRATKAQVREHPRLETMRALANILHVRARKS